MPAREPYDDVGTLDAEDRLRPIALSVPWPAPPGPAAYTGLLGELVDAIDPHTEADRVALLIQAIVVLGVLVGRGPHFLADGARHGLNLFAVLVGRSAKGRKGSALEQVLRVFRQVDPDVDNLRQSGLSTGEGLICRVRDPVPDHRPRGKGGSAEWSDPGVSDKRLLVIEAELARMLQVMQRDGNTLSAVLRVCWDGLRLETLTKHSQMRATGAHIALVGHITRDELIRSLDSTETANGFANRFLFACVCRSKLLPDGGAFELEECPDLLAGLRHVILEARERGDFEMRRDQDARAYWHTLYAELSRERSGLLGAVTARAEAQVMRLACLYALADGFRHVGVRHIKAAQAVWAYCDASCRYIFGDALGDRDADEILRALRQAGSVGLTRSEISSNVFGRHRSAASLTRALETLLEAGLVRGEVDNSGAGRPVERWYVA